MTIANGTGKRRSVSVAGVVFGLFVLLFAAAVATTFIRSSSVLAELARIMERQTHDSAKLQELASLQSDVVTVRGKLEQIQKDIASVVAQIDDLSKADEPDDQPSDDVRSLADAEEYLAEKLGDSPSADLLAAVAAELESWFVKPDEDEEFSKLRSGLDARLRKQVKIEAGNLHEKALAEESAKKAAEFQANAGRILALYPLSEEKRVLDEATLLARDHADVAARLEVLGRQRYNRWATERIAAGIKGYHENGSYSEPIDENPKLIESLVDNLGEVDPALLEPVVLELYEYVVDLTKSSISETDKVDLARRLTEPTIKRRRVGD